MTRTVNIPQRFLRLTVFAAVLTTASACNPTSALRDLGSPPKTAYDRYAMALRDAKLDQSALGRDWLLASDSALRTPLRVAIPAREVGYYARDEARAVAYRVSLREGQRFRATVRAHGIAAQLFFDLFEAVTDSAAPFEHRVSANAATDTATVADSGTGVAPARDSAFVTLVIAHEATRDGEYVLRLQPELLRSGRYEITMSVEPMLAFPVDGRGNGAIQSLFGVARDGGRREHHGIDIFAPRGTPVLAATDGVVRSVAPNTLGGNVVWLSDERRGQSLYYAHLDRHAVTAGQRVSIGDTLGFVGNTGNARTTAPHLHFGIYRRGQGPIDPLRYVRLVSEAAPRLLADTARLGQPAVTIVREATLRRAVGATDSVLRRMPRSTALRIMGASANSYRVQLDDGTAGYVRAETIRALNE